MMGLASLVFLLSFNLVDSGSRKVVSSIFE